MHTLPRITSAVLGLALFAACQTVSTEPSPVTKITSTTSFGMCVGYCKTTLEITETEAVLVSEQYGRGSGADLAPQRASTPLTAEEWQDIVAAATASAAAFDSLPDRIGCPDCADGGAESLTIVVLGQPMTVVFDYGASIDGVQPLLDRVRAIRLRLKPSAGQ
jgi:hypothetical protein